jgi:hypothetical protein
MAIGCLPRLKTDLERSKKTGESTFPAEGRYGTERPKGGAEVRSGRDDRFSSYPVG